MWEAAFGEEWPSLERLFRGGAASKCYLIEVGGLFVVFLFSVEEGEGRGVGAVDVDHQGGESCRAEHQVSLAHRLSLVDVRLIGVLPLDEACSKKLSKTRLVR